MQWGYYNRSHSYITANSAGINLNGLKNMKLSTGRFIMYSGITKIYYRKTVGYVFAKPLQTEGTT
jgi:hypothetical protein